MTPSNRLSCVVTAVGSSGLGDLVVGAARPGYRTFTSADNGQSFTLLLRQGNAWEIRRDCVYTHSSTSLTRGTIEETSAAGSAAVALAAGATVSVVLSAQDITSIAQSGMTVQSARSSSFSLVAGDKGTVIPILGTVTVTVPTGLGADFFVELLRYDGATLTVSAGSGATLILAGSSVSSTTVAQKGASVALLPGSAANEFFLAKRGS